MQDEAKNRKTESDLGVSRENGMTKEGAHAQQNAALLQKDAVEAIDDVTKKTEELLLSDLRKHRIFLKENGEEASDTNTTNVPLLETDAPESRAEQVHDEATTEEQSETRPEEVEAHAPVEEAEDETEIVKKDDENNNPDKEPKEPEEQMEDEANGPGDEPRGGQDDSAADGACAAEPNAHYDEVNTKGGETSGKETFVWNKNQPNRSFKNIFKPQDAHKLEIIGDTFGVARPISGQYYEELDLKPVSLSDQLTQF